MTATTYHLIDVLGKTANALNEFEESVSGLKYSTVPGYSTPVPTAVIPLVPELVSERWNQELKNLCSRSVNDYRRLVELLEDEEWPDPGWSIVNEYSGPLHCTRFTYHSEIEVVPTEHLLEVSRRFPELWFGTCWIYADLLSGVIGKHEIRNGEILVEENHTLDDDRELFEHISSRWLGISFLDDDIQD
jgi:hypothetical protein